jgi:hypothetical protein
MNAVKIETRVNIKVEKNGNLCLLKIKLLD